MVEGTLPRLSGDKLCESYLLGEEIGRGAYSTVYRATSTRDGTDVAVKLLKRKTEGNEERNLLSEIEVGFRVLRVSTLSKVLHI
jgi:serine/threonine protein kinase